MAVLTFEISSLGTTQQASFYDKYQMWQNFVLKTIVRHLIGYATCHNIVWLKLAGLKSSCCLTDHSRLKKHQVRLRDAGPF